MDLHNELAQAVLFMNKLKGVVAFRDKNRVHCAMLHSILVLVGSSLHDISC